MGTVFLGEDEEVLDMVVVQECDCTECHKTVHLKMVQMIHFILHTFYHNKEVS